MDFCAISAILGDDFLRGYPIVIMRHMRIVFLCSTLLPVFLYSHSFGQDEDSLLVRVVRPGVVHRSIVDSHGPWRINVLEIDLRQTDLSIESGRASNCVYGRETTSAMAARSGDSVSAVVAALNGDFFNLESGESVNNQVSRGEVIRAVVPAGDPASHQTLVRSQIGFRFDNSPVLDRFVFDGKIFWPHGGWYPLAAVNAVRARTPSVLFTEHYGLATKQDSTHQNIAEVPLRRVGRRGDTLVAVIRDQIARTGGLALSSEEMVLSMRENPGMIDSIAVGQGDTIRIYVGFLPAIPGLRSLVGGIPWLVRDGRRFVPSKETLEGAGMQFATRRHPRTGVGFSRDSTIAYFLTVDGRQATSDGMTLEEFADLMMAQGVYQGLNLDGGGSTTMVVDGVVVNSPSDASGERPVANCLLLMERRTRK